MQLSTLRTLGAPAALVLALILATPALGFAAADLVVTSVTNPPTDALPKDSFVVTATVKNNVAVNPSNLVTAPSTTKFSLFNPTSSFKKNLKGVQIVPGLAPQASDSTGVTVEIFSDTPAGTYRLQACADSESKVPEGGLGEQNNCRLSTGDIIVHDLPDLAVTAITPPPPPSVPQGQTFSVTATVVNTGAVKAQPSTVKYYLCTPAPAGGCLLAPDPAKIDLKNLQSVPKLPPGGTFTNPHTLEVRAETTVGSYRVQGCADSRKDVRERDENDNCLTLPAVVQVTPQPDLVVKSVTVAPPMTIDAGNELVITTVVKNEGQADAGPSTIKFVLVNTTNRKNLKDKPSVIALAQGKKQIVQASVRTYDDTPGGVYTIQACADYGKFVGESEESNNCTDGPDTMKVTVNGLSLSDAELAVNAITFTITKPQASAVPGDPIDVVATVKNKGTAPSPATTTKFYLVSATGTRKNLKGVQGVPGLLPDTASAVPVTVEIFSDTDPGRYFLEACADGNEQVHERNEENNCRRSGEQITVEEIPNLVVTTVTTIDVPPTGLLQGQSFKVKETVMNVGAVTAPASSVKYYLCTPSPTGGCLPLDRGGTKIDLKGTQAVPEIPAGLTFSETQEVKVRAETLPGSYVVQACADSGKIVPEPNEEDNCLTSGGTVQVTALADLLVTRVTVENTPVTVALGATFTVTSVVKNVGLGDAGPSTTKFYLIKFPGAALKKDLSGTQAVPDLFHGTKNQAQRVVGVEEDTETTEAGVDYYVLACADSGKAVLENDEGNNCTTSAETLRVVP